jgi:hypothetical protein
MLKRFCGFGGRCGSARISRKCPLWSGQPRERGVPVRKWNAAFMRHVGTRVAQTLSRAARRSWARRTSRNGFRNGAPGRVNAAFQFASGTPHLCGTSGPESLKRFRARRVGPGLGEHHETGSATERPVA